ncbi:hypothetical protein SADUNF_Sadunf01G0123200 [Salix dunnii]|uniref:Uncharacterized protein n=1 Tax=Salix dunnii TaxID=1413687 RepID=A0A835NBI2_9ROSI|nr:hypothetical protein SADUNF_Sadunf01G0123200 [Salix dunnii]
MKKSDIRQVGKRTRQQSEAEMLKKLDDEKRKRKQGGNSSIELVMLDESEDDAEFIEDRNIGEDMEGKEVVSPNDEDDDNVGQNCLRSGNKSTRGLDYDGEKNEDFNGNENEIVSFSQEDSAEVEPDSDKDDKDYNGIFDAEDSEEESSESSKGVEEMSSKEESEELHADGVICRDNHGTHHSSKGTDSHKHKIEAPFKEGNEQVEEPTLPLKFTFGVEESTPAEKTKEEELDKLWAEFDMMLWSLNLTNNRTVEDEADISPEMEADTATLCLQGKHNFILDEEIGITCKYCGHVDLEIRYCVFSPVIIAPRSMLLSREAELLMWGVDIPFHYLNKKRFSDNENWPAMNFLKRVKHRRCSSASTCMVKLYYWKEENSILGISYGLFEKLAAEDKGKSRVRHIIEDDPVRKALLEFPGLLVLDEGCNRFSLTNPLGKVIDDGKEDARLKEVRKMIRTLVHVLKGTILQEKLPGLRESLYLPPLNLICKQLKSQFRWAKGKEVLYMDGALATHKQTLAINRAYKLGQDKIVYVYHLVTSGEEEKYCRQARKERYYNNEQQSLVFHDVFYIKKQNGRAAEDQAGSVISLTLFTTSPAIQWIGCQDRKEAALQQLPMVPDMVTVCADRFLCCEEKGCWNVGLQGPWESLSRRRCDNEEHNSQAEGQIES